MGDGWDDSNFEYQIFVPTQKITKITTFLEPKFLDGFESTYRINFYHKKEILAEMGVGFKSRLERIAGSVIMKK